MRRMGVTIPIHARTLGPHLESPNAIPFEKCARKFVHPSQYWF